MKAMNASQPQLGRFDRVVKQATGINFQNVMFEKVIPRPIPSTSINETIRLCGEGGNEGRELRQPRREAEESVEEN